MPEKKESLRMKDTRQTKTEWNETLKNLVGKGDAEQADETRIEAREGGEHAVDVRTAWKCALADSLPRHEKVHAIMEVEEASSE